LRLAEEGGEWSAIRERSLLADDAGVIGDTSCSCAASAGSSTSVAGSPSPPDTGGSSGDAEGPVVVGNAIVRLFGASAVPVCKAPWPAFHSMSGRQAAPMQRRVGPTAPRGRTRAVREAPGRAFKSLSCARQASRSTEVSATTCNDGGDIRKSKEKVKRGEEEERERVILPSLSSFFPRSPPTLLAAAAEATSTSSLAAPLAHAGDAGCNGSHHLPTTYLALSAPLASDRHLTRRQTRTSTYARRVRRCSNTWATTTTTTTTGLQEGKWATSP